jgi:hypothetical protein
MVRLCEKSGAVASAEADASELLSLPGEANKACTFLCGRSLFDPDPIDASRKRIRWAYDVPDPAVQQNPRGANDWYCQRVWSAESAKKQFRSRDDFQKELKKDPYMVKDWRDKVTAFIARTKALASGKVTKRSAGLKSIRVSKQNIRETSLIRPDDAFWPINRYRKKFGSPNAPQNKKLNHASAIVDGVKGVVVPGDDGEGPFRLRNASSVRFVKDAELDVGSSGGEEDLADEIYDSAVSQHVEDYRQIAVGALSDILAKSALTEEERDALPKRKKRKRSVGTLEKAKNKVHSMFALAASDDETSDSAGEDMRRKQKKSSAMPSGSTPGKKKANVYGCCSWRRGRGRWGRGQCWH